MLRNEKTEKCGTGDRFADDPEGIYRIYNVISYFLVLIVIGLPVWWMTTRVYRASLPLDEILAFDVPNKTIRENSIPLSLGYDVLITILNPEPQNLKVDLDTKVLKTSLESFVVTLSPLANFTIKSQWLYLIELGVTPKKVDDYYVLTENQLPLIITPLEKKIWSHMSPRPTINLIVYVSQCKMPLYIYSNENERVQSNAFLSPSWGGISIINPNQQSCNDHLYKVDLRPILLNFVAQLRELIGLKSSSTEDIHTMKKTKSVDMINSTRRTLKSLAQLLSEISSIVISDEVAIKVHDALRNASEAEEWLRKDDVDKALRAAKLAFHNSESAFSDPSLLALLYFPDDQKYAVYIPLFLPIMIPVFMSLTTIKRWYANEKNKQKTE